MDAAQLEQRRKSLSVGLNMFTIMFSYCLLISGDWVSLLVLGISVLYTINAFWLYGEAWIEIMVGDEVAEGEADGNDQVPEDE